MFTALIHLVGEIGSGGESSPLSVTSPFSEIIRLVQIGIFTGILYLIKEMKKNHSIDDEAHGEVLADVKTIRSELSSMRDEIAAVKSSVGSPIQTTGVPKP